MEMEGHPFTTLQTNEIMALLILTTQKKITSKLLINTGHNMWTLAVTHFCSVLADIILQNLYPVIMNNR
jgi:hypothetical protein